jgi:hypothetical protein
MKYLLILGSSLAGWATGFGLMFALHSSENKLDRPEFADERLMGAALFSAVCTLVGLTFLKALPLYSRPGITDLQRYLTWTPYPTAVGLASALILKSGFATGLISKDSLAIFLTLIPLALSLWLAQRDTEFAEHQHLYLRTSAPAEEFSQVKFEEDLLSRMALDGASEEELAELAQAMAKRRPQA